MSKLRRHPERSLQNAAESYLEWLRLPYIHVEAFGLVVCHRCGLINKRIVKGNVGVPDLVIFTKLGVVLIELKSKTGRLSKEQKEWHASLPAAYKYAVIRSLNELETFLADYI